MASLLSLIKQAIFSRAKSDVTIHERTFVTELLESEHKGDPFALYDFFPRKYRGKSLVITRHLIYFFRCVVLFFIGIVYAFYDVAHKVVTGKWKSQRLTEEVLKRRVPNTKWAKRLHTDKWRGIQSSTGVNAVIFTVVIISAVISLAFSLNFLIREVVLPDNEARINGKGVVSIDQGGLVTQHFFLLNSATCWTTSDIAVSEGDIVSISASGSMYSDVGDMYNEAKHNDTLKYPRSLFYEKTTDEAAGFCIYGRCKGDTLPQFGSLLYQICNETRGAEPPYNPRPYNSDDNSIVSQVDFSKYEGRLLDDKVFHFKAKTSGILYFSFNDILLDDAIVDSIWHRPDTDSLFSDLWRMGVNLYNDDTAKRKIPISKSSKRNDLPKSQSDTIKNLLKQRGDSLVWFYDNLGEALINVRVEKNIWNNDMPVYKKLLVALYRVVNGLTKKTSTTISCWSYPSWLIKHEKICEGLDSVHAWLEKPRHYRLYLAILIVIAYFSLDAFVSSLLNPQKHKSRPNRRRKSKTV